MKNKRLKETTITIEIKGITEGDKWEALREALSKIEEGCYSGFDSNDDGAYSFTVKDHE